jgi:HD-like signal output (HDOD) protein
MASELGLEPAAVDARGLRDRVRATLSRLSWTGELPSLPGAVSAALAVARDPEASVDRLCRAIQTDVGIAARVVRVANSVVYGRRTQCKTLRDAVTTVGLGTMRDILSAAALRALCDRPDAEASRLWNHALAVGLAAEELAAMLGGVRRGEAFLPGLFHDLGHVVFFLTDPEAYGEIQHLEETSAGGRLDLELAWYGFDHAEAGAAMASEWGLPADICAALRWHHAPETASVGQRLAEVVCGADRIATLIGLGSRPGVVAESDPLAALMPPDDVAACAERVREAFTTERALFA